MIRIHFQEPVGDPEWDKWRKDCAAAQAKVNEVRKAGQEVKYRGALYGRMKESVYLAADGPFHGNCAFCESDLRRSQHGETEHYRPKAAVTNEDDTRVRVTIDGVEQDHPGYYWLAYDWENFLPACQLCNQTPNAARTPGAGDGANAVTGRPPGKRNRFPLTDESERAVANGEEGDEDPLLINPVKKDPADHILMDETGVFYARNGSKYGETTIRLLGLNDRTDLVAARRKRYKDILNAIGTIAMFRVQGATAEVLERVQELAAAKAGKGEYTAAVRKAINDGDERLGHPSQWLI